LIAGIGVDIVNIDRIEAALLRFGDRFSQRILGTMELVEFSQHAQPARFLAKRFAAKEATAKALGSGFRAGLKLSDIQVTHDALGKPLLHLSGQAAVLADAHALCASHLSLSDETNQVVAFVVLETGWVVVQNDN